MSQPTLKDILQTLLADPAQDLLLNSMKTAIDEAENSGKHETPYDLNFGQADARLTVQGNGWHAVADLVNSYLAQRGWWFYQLEEARDVPPISRGILKRIPDNQVPAQPQQPQAFEQEPAADVEIQMQELPGSEDIAQQEQVPLQNASSVGVDDTKKRGICKWYNLKKGFGFITPDDAQLSDVFVHRSEIHARAGTTKSLGEEEVVEFYIRLDESGRAKAVEVTGPDGDFVQGRRRRANKPAPLEYDIVPPQSPSSQPAKSNNHVPQHEHHESAEYSNSQSSRAINGSSSNSGKRQHDPTVVVTGKCKWYNVQKGFGFVTPDDGTPDIFVHRSEVNSNSPFKSLAEGEPVEFFVRIDEHGRPKAVSVTGPHGTFVQGMHRRRGGTRARGPRMRNSFQNAHHNPTPPITDYSSPYENSDLHEQQNGEVKIPEERKEKRVHQTLDISKIDTKTQKTGVCKWFNRKKGFGFITIDHTDMDVFVNRADLYSESDFKTLAEGEKVEFFVGMDEEHRPKATGVTGPNGSSVRGYRPSRPRRGMRR